MTELPRARMPRLLVRIRTAARIGVICGLCSVTILSAPSCSSACPFWLAQKVVFSSDPEKPFDPPVPVPCCGGFLFSDVNLNLAGVQQMDLANGQVNAGHVDAFLVSADCAQLFAGPYNGSVVQPLCTIYLGPVAAGTISERKKISPGKYRLFAQAWASNESEQHFAMDVGMWSDDCRLSPTAPR
jgi:hypothetical protein